MPEMEFEVKPTWLTWSIVTGQVIVAILLLVEATLGDLERSTIIAQSGLWLVAYAGLYLSFRWARRETRSWAWKLTPRRP